jgi:hypothetical protein
LRERADARMRAPGRLDAEARRAATRELVELLDLVRRGAGRHPGQARDAGQEHAPGDADPFGQRAEQVHEVDATDLEHS